jgi:cbb3-type cytochrome oxidase subunit 1
MKRVADRFLQLGVLGAVVGMSLGCYMGMKENFTLAPAHAHINLLVWVSMTLYGLFYKVMPKAAAGLLPTVHFWLNVVAVLVMLPALVIMLLAQANNAPVLGVSFAQSGMVLGISSILALLSMILFLIIVWRATWKPQDA